LKSCKPGKRTLRMPLAMLGRPISSTGLDVVIDVSLQRDLNNGLLVIGETSLPDGTRLTANLHRREPGIIAQASCTVKDRRLLLGPMPVG
jgi:hypothetical protein